MKQESIVYVIFSFGNGGTQKMLTNILNLVKLPAKKTTVYLYNNTSKDNIDFKLDLPKDKSEQNILKNLEDDRNKIDPDTFKGLGAFLHRKL